MIYITLIILICINIHNEHIAYKITDCHIIEFLFAFRDYAGICYSRLNFAKLL